MQIKLTPNVDVVMVVQKDRRVLFYPISHSVKGYLRKCKNDGKEASYAGRTDKNGLLIVNK